MNMSTWQHSTITSSLALQTTGTTSRRWLRTASPHRLLRTNQWQSGSSSSAQHIYRYSGFIQTKGAAVCLLNTWLGPELTGRWLASILFLHHMSNINMSHLGVILTSWSYRALMSTGTTEQKVSKRNWSTVPVRNGPFTSQSFMK